MSEFNRTYFTEGFNDEGIVVTCPNCDGNDSTCDICNGLGVIIQNNMEADPAPEPMRPDRGVNYQHGYTGQDSSWTGF